MKSNNSVLGIKVENEVNNTQKYYKPPVSNTYFPINVLESRGLSCNCYFFSFTNLCQVVVIYTFYFADTLSSLWSDGTLSLYIQFLLGKAGTSIFVYQDLHGSSFTGMRLVTSTISSNSSNSIDNILIIVLIVFY